MKSSVFRELFVVLGLLAVFFIAIVGISSMTKSIKNPPKLEVVGGDKLSTTDSRLTITGKVDPKARLVAGKDKVAVDKDGNFSYALDLKDGEQKVLFVASRGYSQNKKEITVTRIVEIPSNTAATSSTLGPVGTVYTPSTVSTDLVTSGPRENIMGAFGLTAIVCSAILYKRSAKKRFYGYRAFTFS